MSLFLDVPWSAFFLEESQANNTGGQSYPLLLSYHCTTLNSVGYLVKSSCPELNFRLEPQSSSETAHIAERVCSVSYINLPHKSSLHQ